MCACVRACVHAIGEFVSRIKCTCIYTVCGVVSCLSAFDLDFVYV